MSLNNISNFLNKLQKFYDPNRAGSKYTGTDNDLDKVITAFGAGNSVKNVELHDVNGIYTGNIIEGGVSVTISAFSNCQVSYKVDSESRKVTIFGNNITVTVSEENEDLIDIVGISNEIKATSKSDKITLYGYDNKVDAADGEDTVTVYGEDNQIKDAEENIFKGIGGQYLIYGENKILASSDDSRGTTINLSETGDKLNIAADNARLQMQNDGNDDISLIGDNNYLDTSVGADNISVKGEKNIVITGDDESADNVTVDGAENQIIGGVEDEVHYTGQSGNITIDSSDNSAHYLEIQDSLGVTHKFLISRNTEDSSTVEISYEINDEDKIILKGDNFEIQVNDENSSNIIVSGNGNKIIAGTGNDEIGVVGDNNVILPGTGNDNIYINGSNNQVSGDEKDFVYYTLSEGGITLTSDDESVHYIDVGGFKYLVERNMAGAGDIVNIEYKLNDNGVFEFKGNNFSIQEQNDKVKDNVKIIGNNTYVDTGDGDDKISIKGNYNVVTAGEGDDSIIVDGSHNDISGDAGDDGIAVSGSDNIINDDIEHKDDEVYTISGSEAKIINLGDKQYTISLTEAAKKSGSEVSVYVKKRDSKIIVEADDVIVRANSGQADVIEFVGNNSKIYAGDKNDVINVLGDNNIVDGWSGDDKITVTGINNNAYGFLGNDEITVVQRANTEAEISEAKEKDIDEETLAKNSANFVDGEYDTDSVNASKFTNVSKNTEIYKSDAQSILITPDDKQKKIVVGDKTYTISNFAGTESNNPFAQNRTISYEVVNNKLIVKGDYISVVADDGQEDDVKIIGNGSKLDLGDMNDYLEAEGNYNLIFGGIGSDNLTVKGANNIIHSDVENKISSNDNDVIYVEGDNNNIIGGKGNNDTLHVSGKNVVWSDVEFVNGNFDSKYTLTNKEREKTIVVGDNKKYTIKVNSSNNENLTSGIPFSYEYDKDNHVLKLSGNNLSITAAPGQEDAIEFIGNNCVIELGDKEDNIIAQGSGNKIYGGAGNDTIKIVGESFKVFAQEGNDTISSNAINSTLDGGLGTDTLNISNQSGSNNKISNFEKTNNSPNEGVVVLSSSNSTGEIKCTLNGQQIRFVVQPNINAYPNDLTGEIYVKYEVKEETDDYGQTSEILCISGNGIKIAPPQKTVYNTAIFARIEGDNIIFDTSAGDDYVEVIGNQNTVSVKDGQNAVYVEGNNNKITSSDKQDMFVVHGDENIIVGGNSNDDITLVGERNEFRISIDKDHSAGSITLTKDTSPQNVYMTINGKIRGYRMSIYNVEKSEIETAKVEIQYYVDAEGYTTFVADYARIEVLDVEETQTTDRITTDNGDSLKLIGNHCYITGSHGNDVLVVQGEYNKIDGWYGNDSLTVIGENNEVRGFYGDDVFNIDGNKNVIDGEQGTDTLTIIAGENNTHTDVEHIKKV